jgi:FkbM family methyltransferase
MSVLQATAGKIAERVGRDSWLVRSLRPMYESLLDCTSLGNGIPWTINGTTFRIDPHHRWRMAHEYDSPVAAFLREKIQPGWVCLDVGANLGVYVLQFAHWSGPGGRVIAFEPNPAARRELSKHIRMNGLTERVKVVPAAVAAVSGDATLFAADVDGMSRLGEPNPAIAAKASPIRVPTVTLDDYCMAHHLRPNVLLIDIEGFEIAALAGARRLIESRGEDLTIIVEMHPEAWSSANTSRVQAESLLSELGLNVTPLMGQMDPLDEHASVLLSY